VQDQAVHKAASLANCQALHALAGWQADEMILHHTRPSLQ
jgi:hypothetical protein